MRFKLALGLGLAIGYLMGARAGRQSYDRIVKVMKDFWAQDGGKLMDSATRVQEQASGAIGALFDRKVALDAEGVEKTVEPYVAAAHPADGGVLPHGKPL
jgi:hypothetical protein